MEYKIQIPASNYRLIAQDYIDKRKIETDPYLTDIVLKGGKETMRAEKKLCLLLSIPWLEYIKTLKNYRITLVDGPYKEELYLTLLDQDAITEYILKNE